MESTVAGVASMTNEVMLFKYFLSTYLFLINGEAAINISVVCWMRTEILQLFPRTQDI